MDGQTLNKNPIELSAVEAAEAIRDGVISSEQLVQACLDRIVEDIRAGSDLSAAMSKYPTVFSNIYLAMIRAGGGLPCQKARPVARIARTQKTRVENRKVLSPDAR